LDLDPHEHWPTGMAYLEDRHNGITSGRDTKQFQAQIAKDYNNRITIDDAKELLNIAYFNGNFEYYLRRDHGIVVSTHSAHLINYRTESLRVRNIFEARGGEIVGVGTFRRLKESIETKGQTTLDIYVCGSLPNMTEKRSRSLFAILQHSIERQVVKECVIVAQEMRLIVFSSVFDGIQLIHPQCDDWVELLDAFKRECNSRVRTKFHTEMYLVEKPFFITDEDTTPRDNEDATKERSFGRILQTAYGVDR